jgi:hypothetical protein
MSLNNLLTSADNVSTTLNGSITSSVLSLTLASSSLFGTITQGVILIDGGTTNAELVTFSNRVGVTVTIDARGQGNTAAAAHTTGATIELVDASNYQNGIVTNISVGHNDDGTHKTNLPLTTPVLATPTIRNWDGWMDANETWTYASASTITVPTDATTKYQIGDKIKLTQTTVKYFYITGVTSTVLTITGGSDYTLVNAAITANYYSKTSNPQGFPHFFSYAPFAWGGFSVNPVATTTFCLTGKIVTVFCIITSAGTSNANNHTMGLPIVSGSFNTCNGRTDASVGYTDWRVANSATNIEFAASGSFTGWATTGSKYANVGFSYRI